MPRREGPELRRAALDDGGGGPSPESLLAVENERKKKSVRYSLFTACLWVVSGEPEDYYRDPGGSARSSPVRTDLGTG